MRTGTVAQFLRKVLKFHILNGRDGFKLHQNPDILFEYDDRPSRIICHNLRFRLKAITLSSFWRSQPHLCGMTKETDVKHITSFRNSREFEPNNEHQNILA
jgi:hypothetical protein